MKKTHTIALLAMTALALASPLSAQRPGPARPGIGPGPSSPLGERGMGPRLERVIVLALERRDTLELSTDQIRALEELRSELDQSEADLREQAEMLREEAGADGEEIRERMRELMESVREAREAQRERYEQILTRDQQDRLAPLIRRQLRGQRAGRGPQRFRDRPRGPAGRRGLGMGLDRFGGGFEAAQIAQAYLQGWRDGVRVGARRAGGLRRSGPVR